MTNEELVLKAVDILHEIHGFTFVTANIKELPDGSVDIDVKPKGEE